MKKPLILFIILVVCAAAGAVWIGYDAAKLGNEKYSVDTREYEPVSREAATAAHKETESSKTEDEKSVSQNITGDKAAYYRLESEYGYVVIYNEDDSLYDKTDIKMSSLPRAVQIEILNGKELFSERELYDFLETYST